MSIFAETKMIVEMKRFYRLLVTAAVAAIALSCAEQPVLQVEGGLIQGINSAAKGVTVFKGIPYAAPPVDTLRWRVPQPVIPWEGVKVADTFGKIAWQDDLSKLDLFGKEFYAEGMPEMSEDCLYLNVWAPSKTVGDKDAKLPVAVWIHGGAFRHGFSYEKSMDGDAWAKEGVILVTIAYRVGLLGFFGNDMLAKEPGSENRCGNYGIYDQYAALKWVNENIASFGGDPNNVTIFGQSAGARSVQTLVSTILARPYISKAIMQSGGGISVSQQKNTLSFMDIRKAGNEFCEWAGYETLEQLRAVSPQDLRQKYVEYQAEGGNIPFGPMLDLYLIGNSFTTASALNNVMDIPYMIGFTTGDGRRSGIDIDEFCASRNYYNGKPVFEYQFDRALPGDDAGAFHTSELWYTFGTLDRAWRPFTEADHELSEEMIKAWTNFCKYGNPCGPEQTDYWPPFTSDNPYRKVFNVKENQ